MDDKEVLSWGKTSDFKFSKNWPKLENGEYEEPALLETCRNINFEDDMVTALLDSCEIPSFKRYPGNGSFGKLVLGLSGEGVEIYVPESKLSLAQEFLREENNNEL